MPVRPRVLKSLAVAFVSLSAAFALSIALLGCGVSSTANEWSWANGSKTVDASGLYGLVATGNVREAHYNWTDSSERVSDSQTYAANATEQQSHFWEFGPAPELWSWVSVRSPQDDVYVASMPEMTTPTDNAWTWVNGSNTADADGTYSLAATSNVSGPLYSWTDSRGNVSDAQTYASNATIQSSRFWEFSPAATETWSWVSGGSAQEKVYLASMPELDATANGWSWVNGSDSLGAGGSYGVQGLAAANNVHGARCAPVNWIESAAAPSSCVGDELQASLNDYWRYGP